MTRIAGIVLAAGLSTRMGSLKLLLELNNETIIYKVINAALLSRLDEVVLVTGTSHHRLLQSLDNLATHFKLRITQNSRPEAGMSSSIRAGMSSLKDYKDGIMIILGDQPKLTTAIIDQLGSVFSESPSSIVAPKVQGRRTTPVIFPVRFFPALVALTGDRGGRPILEANPEAVIEVEMGDAYDDIDIDTPEDWEKFRKEYQNG